MDLTSLGVVVVGAITVICFLFGQWVKATGLAATGVNQAWRQLANSKGA